MENMTNGATTSTIKIYTLKELETVLNVTYRSLLTYIKTGKLKAVKIGHSWRVSEDNLKAFINGN